MKSEMWSDFNVLEEDDSMTIHAKLDQKLEQLLVETNLEEVFNEVLAEAKIVIERTGGDWNLSCKSIENMLHNLRETIKHSMIPDDVISQLPNVL